MEGKLEIVGLYEFNDEYQVIDSNRTVWFQGSKVGCKKYIKQNKMYSEEEVLEILKKHRSDYWSDNTVEEWFEEFKNK